MIFGKIFGLNFCPDNEKEKGLVVMRPSIIYAACFPFRFFIWFKRESNASSNDSSKDLVVVFTKK